MIWFDFDNSPHIPVFRPILKELNQRNIDYYITARDFAQTRELLEFWNIEGQIIGKHGGKHKIVKLANLIHRGTQLRSAVHKRNIRLAVSHGSRTQLIASSLLNIKAIWLLDYEYTEISLAKRLASNILMPGYIPSERLASAGFNLNKIIRYNGYKEELYLKDFRVDCTFRQKLGVEDNKILIVFRPPSLTANYHNNASEKLLIEGLEYLNHSDNVDCIVINRTIDDRKLILSNIKELKNIRFLEKPVDGLQLLFAADIAISGGGTMNREAALLGTRTYSIFTGKRPYLDDQLAMDNRLKFISSSADFYDINLCRIEKEVPVFSNNLAEEITNIIIELSK